MCIHIDHVENIVVCMHVDHVEKIVVCTHIDHVATLTACLNLSDTATGWTPMAGSSMHMHAHIREHTRMHVY